MACIHGFETEITVFDNKNGKIVFIPKNACHVNLSGVQHQLSVSSSGDDFEYHIQS